MDRDGIKFMVCNHEITNEPSGPFCFHPTHKLILFSGQIPKVEERDEFYDSLRLLIGDHYENP